MNRIREAAAGGSVKELAARGTRLKLDIEAGSPLLILPMYYLDKRYHYFGLKWWLAVVTMFSLVPMAITIKNEFGIGHGSGIP